LFEGGLGVKTTHLADQKKQKEGKEEKEKEKKKD